MTARNARIERNEITAEMKKLSMCRAASALRIQRAGRRSVMAASIASGVTGLRTGYRMSYRAIVLKTLEPFDDVAWAQERTYHDPGTLNLHASRARPVELAGTETRR